MDREPRTRILLTSSRSNKSALYSIARASSSFIFHPPESPPTVSFWRASSNPTSISWSRIFDLGTSANALSATRYEGHGPGRHNVPHTGCHKIENGQARIFPLECMLHHDTPELILGRKVLDLTISKLPHKR